MRAAVKCLHLDGDGGLGVLLFRVVKGDVFPARHGDGFSNIVRRLSHIDRAVARHIEECDGLSRGRSAQNARNAVHFLLKQRRGLVLLADERTVELDPLHAAKRLALVAGHFHEHGDAQRFKLLDDLGRVVDHRVFKHQIAALRQDKLVIRLGVFARVKHVTRAHGLLRLLDIPVRLLASTEADAVDRVQLGKAVHRRAGDQINFIERLLQNCHALRHAAGHGRSLRHEQEFLILPDGDALVVVPREGNRKLRGIVKRHGLIKRQSIPRDRRIFAVRTVLRFVPAGAERQHGQQREKRARQASHPFTSALEASNVSV